MRYWWGWYRKQKKNTEGKKWQRTKKRKSREKRQKRKWQTGKNWAAQGCTVFYFGSGGLRSRHNSNPQGGFFWSRPLPSKCPISTDSTKHTFTLSIRKTGSMARLTPLLFSFSFTCNLICTGFRWKRRAHIHIETQTDKQLSTDRKHEALSGISGMVKQGIMDEFSHFCPSRIHRVNRYEQTVKTTSQFSTIRPRTCLNRFYFPFLHTTSSNFNVWKMNMKNEHMCQKMETAVPWLAAWIWPI